MACSRAMTLVVHLWNSLKWSLGPITVLIVSLLIGFSGLVAHPGALIVDGERPWIDEGYRPRSRPIGNDLTGLFLPRFLWQSDLWNRDRSIPHWDPRGFAGRPNVGNPQAGLWYLPTWVAWSWGDPAALGWLTVLHLLWLGAGMVALGRAIGLGIPSATLAGLVTMMNPYVIAQVHEGHLPHVWSVSWYPWAFLGAVLLRRNHPIGWQLVSLSLALSLMTGHPQEGAYLALALAAWAAFDGLRSAWILKGRTHRPDYQTTPVVLTRPIRWGLAFLLAAGFAAIEWMPILFIRPWIAGPIGGGGGSSSSLYALSLSNALQLISPRALGGPAEYFGRGNHWETLLSIGWTPLVLVMIGAIGASDRRVIHGWVLLLLMCLWHASGPSLGFARIIAMIPGMGGARVPARSLFLAVIAAAILAGKGLDTLIKTDDTHKLISWIKRYAMVAIAIVTIVTMSVGVNSYFAITDNHRHVNDAKSYLLACERIARDTMAISMIIGMGAILFWRCIHPQKKLPTFMLTLGIVLAELSVSAAIALPLHPAEQFLGRDAVSMAIAQNRPQEPFRVRASDEFYSDLHAWRDALEKTNLGDLFQIRHAAELYRALYPLFQNPGEWPRRALNAELAQTALDCLGVAWIISDRPLRMTVGPIIASGYRNQTLFTVIENPSIVPRARVVPFAEVVSYSESLDRLPEIDPRISVLLPSDPLKGIGGPRQLFTPANYVQEHPDQVIVRVTTEAPGYLVVGDVWMPGWRGTINGQSIPILRGDHAFRVIPLPEPGAIEIVMTYQAPGLTLGKICSASSMVLLVLTGIRRMVRNHRSGQD